MRTRPFEQTEELTPLGASPALDWLKIIEPAVSRMIARLVNHQSMLTVPPEPCNSSCSPGGKSMPECRMASGLPEPDSPG